MIISRHYYICIGTGRAANISCIWSIIVISACFPQPIMALQYRTLAWNTILFLLFIPHLSLWVYTHYHYLYISPGTGHASVHCPSCRAGCADGAGSVPRRAGPQQRTAGVQPYRGRHRAETRAAVVPRLYAHGSGRTAGTCVLSVTLCLVIQEYIMYQRTFQLKHPLVESFKVHGVSAFIW